MARQRIPIPFGGGLDRHTGPMVVDPSSQEDVRGVHLAEGWAHVRRGAAEVSQLSGVVVAGEQLRTEDVLILATYDEASREVHVYRAASNGTAPVHVGQWFTLAEGADEPPRVFMAEVAGLMFLAHDEPVFGRRAPTVYYDRIAGTLDPLAADWAHEGGIRFRGVTEHLGAYLAGWGYGTADEARPDLVRMSMPGEPTVFHPKYYEPIGQRGEAVTRCVSTGRTLLCFTSAQTWEHFGSDRATFGARPVDTNFGLAASRLAIEIDGAVYFWSRSGPRRTTGGLSEDLAIPLELRAPAPADLVAEGAVEHAFATFYPPEDEILFVFGQRVYAHALRTGRWRYDTLPFAPAAAILSQPGVDVDPGYEPGYADALHVIEDLPSGTLRDLRVGWTNEDMAGDEILEFWLDDGEGWTMVDSAPVEPQAQQSHLFEGVPPGKAHRLQVRGRRGTLYRDGYTSNDPDGWPAESRLHFTTGLAAPEITAASWERTSASSERNTLTVEPIYDDIDLELLHDGNVVATASAPHGGPVDMRHIDPAGEELHEYTARHKTADKPDGDEGEPVERWAGPDAPTITGFSGVVACAYTVEWTNADPAAATEVRDAFTSGPDPREVAPPGATSQHIEHGQQVACESELIPVSVSIRHRLTSFGVDDWSQYDTDDSSLELCDDCVTP